MEKIKIKKDGQWVEAEISTESFENISKSLEPEFKVGDWVIDINYKEVYKITGFDGVWAYGLEGDERNGYALSNLRHATKAEIKEHLIKEAERRGYKAGVKVEGFNNTGWIVSTPHWRGYYPEDDSFHMQIMGEEGIEIYQKGKWAEIIKDNTIQIGEYEAEYDGNHVKLGSHYVGFNTIKQLYKAMKNLRK